VKQIDHIIIFLYLTKLQSKNTAYSRSSGKWNIIIGSSTTYGSPIGQEGTMFYVVRTRL